MFSRTWTLLVVIALVVVLWWLHPGTDGGGDRTSRTEVTIWFNGPIEGRQLAAIDAFERRFPQYRVVLGSSATRTGLEGEGNPQRLMCGIAGGVPPEVVEYDRFAVCQWAARDAFLDLNPLIEADQKSLIEDKARLEEMTSRNAPAGEIDPLRGQIERFVRYQVRPDDYYPQTWNECAYQGGQYGVPNYMDDRVLYYNGDLLIQAGLVNAQGEPLPPASWEQVCLKRTELRDAAIERIDKRTARLRSPSADFVAAGVQRGDSVSHIAHGATSLVTRALVQEVVDARTLLLVSPYASRDLVLPAESKQHIKVFDQSGYALRLSRWDEQGRLRVAGFEPHHGNGWLYMYGWMAGGEFLSADGRTCTLDDPRIAEGLQWTVDVYDALGGVKDVNAFKQSFQAGPLDPFFNNQIGMFVNGDWFLREIARYARHMNFGASPPPVPASRIAADPQSGPHFTWVAGFSYCIPATCPPDKLEAAWTLVKYLASVEGTMVMNEHDAQRERGQGRLYMPRLTASKPVNAAQFAAYMNVPGMPESVKRAMQVHIDLLPHGRFRPVSPEGQKLWNAQAEAQDQAWNHKGTPAEVLRFQARQVQAALDRFYNPVPGPTVRWGPMLVVYGIALLILAGGLYLRHRRRYQLPGFMRKEWSAGFMFALPWIVGFVVLSGGPMLFSAILSFTRYDVLSDAVYIGAKNYADLADPHADPLFLKSLGNTVFMTLGVPIGMIVGLALAMLLDTRVRGMSVYRTLFFVPAIMPAVAASILWIWVFNAQNGLLNAMLHGVGLDGVIDWCNARFHTGLRTPIGWLQNELTAKPALILMGLWGAGASMIIWLAGLKEIPTHLYEAAALDGAGPIRRFRHVTLPMLSPYILFNLVMGLIGTFQIFTQAYIMTPNGSPSRSTYFYVYKLFDECFSYFRLGYGAAMAWVLFAIVIVLTALNLYGSKRWVHYAGD